MNATPKISVFISVLNGAASISCAMKTVQHQDHEDLEILAVDDVSTDPTTNTIAEHGDTRWWRGSPSGKHGASAVPAGNSNSLVALLTAILMPNLRVGPETSG